MKKVFGMKNKKKSDDSDEECPSYTDPALLHSTDPLARNSRGISHPHYPPPRPCHGSAGNSPNPRRKNQDTALEQGNKKPQLNESNRNSAPNLVTGEPKRAPPRINIAKKNSDSEGDYCDPIDVQRKEDFIQEMKSRPKDDYSEPWDSTIKTDMASMSLKKQSNSDDENNEYLDPYDTGKEGIIEKRMSRGIGREFGAHGKVLTNEQRRSVDVDPKIHSQAFDPSKSSSDDYDMPWEWKKKLQMSNVKIPKPTLQSQRPKPSDDSKKHAPSAKSNSAPSDDYDEPWEKKQSYLLKTQVPAPSGKPRSPVPLPRSQAHPPNNGAQLYEQPWDAMNQPNSQPAQTDVLYETPWDATMGGNASNGPQKHVDASSRRFSQPTAPASNPGDASRKFSQPVNLASSDDYDTPWEYKNKQHFGMGPPKPSRIQDIPNTQEVNPDIPLDQQSWYHGPLKRQEAEELLRDARDCSFLVRNSESSRKDFSLSMKNNENFLHLKIVRQLDGQFILGQFSKPFMDIPKVIHHYSNNKLNIRGAEHKFLKHPVSAQPEYHTIEPEEDDVAL